jgi:hypothetical protein
MNKIFAAALLFTCITVSNSANADDIVSESRNVDARVVNVTLDGLIDLKLKQGPTASLVIYGEKRYFDKIVTTQNGDTLHITTDIHNENHFGSRPHLRAELTLPGLRELISGGVGGAEVRGFSGAELALALNGVGGINVAGSYRNVKARLSGVGGMTINNGDSDNVELNLRGAGQITVIGQSKHLSAKLGGVGKLDAQQLRADSIDVDMTGLGSATVYAKNSATMHLSGMGHATVYGNPAKRVADNSGMGGISWE